MASAPATLRGAAGERPASADILDHPVSGAVLEGPAVSDSLNPALAGLITYDPGLLLVYQFDQ